MRWFIYNALFTVGYLAMLPRFILRMRRRGGYGRGFMQRFGFYDAETRAALRGRRRIWVHAVSVGEIFIALRFIRECRERRSDAVFVLSTTTSTGYRMARERLHADDVLIYFPADFPVIVRRVLSTIDPRALILTECELWPNLIRLSRRRGVPVALINGRISERSFRGYRKVRWFAAPVLRMMNLLLVQTAADSRRLEALGAAAATLHCMGTAKYDVAELDAAADGEMRAVLHACGFGTDKVLLVGGSTWDGEEAALVEVYKALRPAYPALRLVLVPRHAERRDAVETVLRGLGVRHVRRSDVGADGARNGAGPDADVLLVDTTGELRSVYACADLIFVGKSLTEHGGQNPIEPAACGKPIVVGPNMENFPVVIDDLLESEAILQIGSRAELLDAVRRLLDDSGLRARYGRNARELVRRKRGALSRSLDLLAAHDCL